MQSQRDEGDSLRVEKIMCSRDKSEGKFQKGNQPDKQQHSQETSIHGSPFAASLGLKLDHAARDEESQDGIEEEQTDTEKKTRSNSEEAIDCNEDIWMDTGFDQVRNKPVFELPSSKHGHSPQSPITKCVKHPSESVLEISSDDDTPEQKLLTKVKPNN